jgi:mannose-6-phosphate isomerase-like protein (cupin superfamily)
MHRHEQTSRRTPFGGREAPRSGRAPGVGRELPLSPIDRLLPFTLAARDGEWLRFGEVDVLVRASAEATGGAFALFEEHEPSDTGLHVHAREDELFYALEGEHVIQVGETEHRIGPGGMVFAPRGVPHAQRRVVPRTGSVLVVVSPAGFEGFFRELAAADRAGVLGRDAYARASERYGITWLG